MADDKLCEQKNKGKGKSLSYYLREDLKEVKEWILLIPGESVSAQKTTTSETLTYSRKSKGASVGGRV